MSFVAFTWNSITYRGLFCQPPSKYYDAIADIQDWVPAQLLEIGILQNEYGHLMSLKWKTSEDLAQRLFVKLRVSRQGRVYYQSERDILFIDVSWD